jgi:hypothetical protein
MKKLVLPIITLIVGFIAGYYTSREKCPEISFADSKNLTAESKTQLNKLYADSSFGLADQDTISHHISDSLAHVLIQEFQDQNGSALFPLKTINGQHLKGYFIDRKPLDFILKDKTFDGISVYFAKDSTAHVLGKTNRTFTLIYMGGKYNKNYRAGVGTDTRILNVAATGTDSLYDFIKPCPDFCGGFISPTADKNKANRTRKDK